MYLSETISYKFLFNHGKHLHLHVQNPAGVCMCGLRISSLVSSSDAKGLEVLLRSMFPGSNELLTAYWAASVCTFPENKGQ